jgi:hypothetical protein
LLEIAGRRTVFDALLVQVESVLMPRDYDKLMSALTNAAG